MTEPELKPDPARTESANEPETDAAPPAGVGGLLLQSERAHRLALGLMLALAAVVVVSLPFAVRSMAGELLGRQQDTLYDALAAGEVAPTASEEATTKEIYYNLAIVDIDEAVGTATLAVSGNRTCPLTCPRIDLTFLALDDNAAQRRGLPPSASLTIPEGERIFSESVTLPVRGRPNLYPFDSYVLWLGIDLSLTGPGGDPFRPDLAMLNRLGTVTLQSQVSGLVMAPPTLVDPARVRAPSDPFALPLVGEFRWERPAYVKILAVILILLIAASGIIALMTRAIDDLLLGVGGLILGVWGIRSVLVSQPLPGASAIDLALSFVILFLLLGLIVRLIRHFHRGSNLAWPGFGRAKT